MLDSQEKELERKLAENEQRKQEIEQLYDKKMEELQRISGFIGHLLSHRTDL